MDLLKTQTVNASITSTDGYMSVLGAFQVIQDAITELTGLHKIDGVTAKREYNAFWVFVKTHVNFVKKLAWNEKYTVNAFFSYISVVKMNVDVQIKNAAGELAVCSKTELCALDLETHRIRKTSTVGVVPEMLSESKPVDIQFTKFEECELPLKESVCIRSTNIDFSHHTNNSEYVRFVMNTFSVAETEAAAIKEMEIIYAGQSFEGDVLDVKKAEANGKCLVVLEKGGSPVIKCEIVY